MKQPTPALLSARTGATVILSCELDETPAGGTKQAQWFKAKHTVAYWDMFGHPETMPPYALGELDFWWYDADKADALRKAGAIR